MGRRWAPVGVAVLAIGLVAAACTDSVETPPTGASLVTTATEAAPDANPPVITGDIGRSTLVAEWPAGSEPSPEQIAEVERGLDAAGGAALLPIGAMRSDATVQLELIVFHLRDEDHVAVTAWGPDRERVLALLIFPLERTGPPDCVEPDGGRLIERRFRAAEACVTRKGGRIQRIEWAENQRLISLRPGSDEAADWVEGWFWLPQPEA